LTINDGLTSAFSAIRNNTNSVYMLLLRRESVPRTRSDAGKWEPVASREEEITNGVHDFIESLETEIGHSRQLRAGSGSSSIAFYEFKAPSRPGKYSIPIKLEFYKPDGSKALNEQVVTYEVSSLH
jgi:hypothetical protein